MRFVPPLLVAIAVASACHDPVAADPIGTWGGTHIALIVTASDGTVEYDCATGTITEPVRVGSDGSFDAAGTFSPGHGDEHRRVLAPAGRSCARIQVRRGGLAEQFRRFPLPESHAPNPYGYRHGVHALFMP